MIHDAIWDGGGFWCEQEGKQWQKKKDGVARGVKGPKCLSHRPNMLPTTKSTTHVEARRERAIGHDDGGDGDDSADGAKITCSVAPTG